MEVEVNAVVIGKTPVAAVAVAVDHASGHGIAPCGSPPPD